MLLLHDFDAFEEELTVEVECGEVRGEQNSSGYASLILHLETKCDPDWQGYPTWQTGQPQLRLLLHLLGVPHLQVNRSEALLPRYASPGQAGRQPTFLSIHLHILEKLLWSTVRNFSLNGTMNLKEKQEQIPTPGIEPGPRRGERRILTTRPRGKCCDLERVLITAQSYDLAFIGHWPAWKSASLVRVINSLRLTIYFWSDCSVICQQKAVCPPSTSFRKYRMVINLKKQMKRLKLTFLSDMEARGFDK